MSKHQNWRLSAEVPEMNKSKWIRLSIQLSEEVELPTAEFQAFCQILCNIYGEVLDASVNAISLDDWLNDANRWSIDSLGWTFDEVSKALYYTDNL